MSHEKIRETIFDSYLEKWDYEISEILMIGNRMD